jgi:TPR repeat protein
MYKNGWGVQQDYVQAYFWFSLAVSYYFDFEEMNLERARQNRQAVAAKMTPAEIEAAQKLARDFAPKENMLGASTKLIGR